MFVRHITRSSWGASLRPLMTFPLALLCLLSVSTGSLFVYLGAEVREPEITVVDQAILQVVKVHTLSWPLALPENASLFGSAVFVAGVAVCLAVALLWRRRRLDALFVAVAITGSAALTLAMKDLIGRPRPAAFFRVPEQGYSFPSGHTLSATCLACVLAYLVWRSTWRRGAKLGASLLLACAVAVVGASRLVLGVHYLTDVVGSIVLGTAWITALIAVRSAMTYWGTRHES